MGEVNTFKRKKPLDIDWKLLLPTDDALDDHPPDLVITKSKGGGDGGGGVRDSKTEKEDVEYRMKTDGELEDMIPRIKQNILTLSGKLPDKGEKFKATLRRCVAEVERRKKIVNDKGDTRCEDAIQLSDKSNDDSKNSDFFYIAPMGEYGLTVNAFQEDLFFINPRHGRKMKQKCQLPAPGRRSPRLQLSSRQKPFRCPTSNLVDSERQMISNGDKKVSHSVTSSPRHFVRNKPSSFPKVVDACGKLSASASFMTHAFEDQPSTRLRPRPYAVVIPVATFLSAYRLVDEEEPVVWNATPYAENLDDCMKDVKVYYPSRDDQDSVEVSYEDMACLAPEAYLSSTIMNFYIRYLHQLTSSENKRSNHHFFNTYFYNKLQKLSYREDSFLKFRKWWKCVNIFEKAYILLPIHEKAHWSLGIICFPTKEDELGPIVLHLDSLGLHHDSRSIFNNIRRFVKEEWSYLRNSEDPLDLPITDEIWENLDCQMEDRKVPQQRNSYDCGLFVLFYMERFIKEAPERMRKEDLSMFNKQWFHPDEASNLRVRIHNLLVQEFKIAKDKENINC
ncbi:hypothetical protein L6452_12962 [Arctium lappa]|uniref:Uncharacterized protein n=1 Tax=Arctium lappa TaxID=4217 RepID=A0ACB9CGX8_ARCLA|nr:hypothetical protein L6452_12962 [Arctium lappa]